MIRRLFTIVAALSLFILINEVRMWGETQVIVWSFAHDHPHVHVFTFGLPSTLETISRIAIASILPLCWTWCYFYRWRPRLQRELSLCQRCGYDLRATPDRCPECGTEVASKKEANA